MGRPRPALNGAYHVILAAKRTSALGNNSVLAENFKKDQGVHKDNGPVTVATKAFSPFCVAYINLLRISALLPVLCLSSVLTLGFRWSHLLKLKPGAS